MKFNNPSSLLLLITLHGCLSDKVEVKLSQGILLGSEEKTMYRKQNYYAFKGIPFAETPTGELRFQPPKPHKGWDGTYEAYENKPTCVQFNSRVRKVPDIGISGSEDCLYVNVYTPAISGAAPVIVFDFNDNFRSSFNGSDTYAPDYFIEEGVIVVTISHRLGVFGYLTTEDEVIPGNAGLRDFILGLQWVQNNIEKFGGDTSKVTLMGNRGGAALVDILLYSEKAKNLFSSAIIQSGTSFEAMYFYENPKHAAYELGELLDIVTNDSTTLLRELQKVEAETLLNYELKIIDSDHSVKYQISSFPFAPTIEQNRKDGVLTILPENGRVVNDVPIIIGFNSREGLDLISHFLIEPKLLTHKAEENILTFPIRTNMRFDRNSLSYKEAVKDILEFYFQDKSLHYGNILEHAVYVQDSLQNYALDLAAKKLAERLKSSVYYYVFDFRGQLNEITQFLSTLSRFSLKHHGATVGDELCYLLVCSRIKKSYEKVNNLPSEQAEIKVLKKMVRLWSNFAKTRNPTPEKEDDVLKGFVWKPVTHTGAPNFLHITKQLRMKTEPLGTRRKFWDQFLDKYSKLVVDGVVTDALEQRDELEHRDVLDQRDEIEQRDEL